MSKGIDFLKKKPSTEAYKSSTPFSEPKSAVRYSLTPSVESLIKAPSSINFQPPTSTHPYSLFANLSFFSTAPTPAKSKEPEEPFKGKFSTFLFGDSSKEEEEEQ